ncbi:MAG: tRNA (adenosine(37)-N6)-threonylcarbamoyltransferase complex ATPase subunit type 1 TsaE [Eubacteriales bacterium]|nr:tRNA (adenosine(37)-N6)-threonylcarbamoyltransferase complex ATPase subunit type 1 TsaE [Christensenellaceae bacterium]MDY2750751.1 tRNA (adenosine(37)-N6)-threonylcarbamoyltransferase complex ATPase subunit type 1 TsaE [Eubacteriales bacterium]MDD6360748.1 tRNA (adenosine(37)-N6)-threonylcarbamoyltransferase complex ATPase subunit type 1 TsaE [Christensenellaceae bacterium]MDD7092008.1 tRNA (adenosine(37)-N6)-threonylcarbamoyltransferase complex ATPase subunit type 1 TsaE [Christensenellacea
MKYYSKNARDTQNIAKNLAKTLSGGEVILLNGDLGAGKTTFTKGLVKGLGGKKTVVSPTFTIMHSYDDTRIPVYHFDMYRIADEDELYELGLEEYLYENGVAVIEWNKFSRLPEKTVTVNIVLKGGNEREIEIC